MHLVDQEALWLIRLTLLPGSTLLTEPVFPSDIRYPYGQRQRPDRLRPLPPIFLLFAFTLGFFPPLPTTTLVPPNASFARFVCVESKIVVPP